MSTNIYQAFRFKKEKWIDFIDIVHDQMFNSALTEVKSLMKVVKIDEEKLARDIKAYAPDNNKKQKHNNFRKWAQFDAVMALSKEAADRHEKDFFDIDCGVSFWMYGPYVYAIPIGPNKILKNLDLPKWVEDYSYWTGSDAPTHIPEKQWDRRGETWNMVNCGKGRSGHNARMLFHSVVDLEHRGAYVSKTDFQLKIFPR